MAGLAVSAAAAAAVAAAAGELALY